MERSKGILCIILIFTFTSNYSQINYNERIYSAYIKGNMENWEEILKEIEKENSNNLDQNLDLLNYYYGYTAFLIGNKKNKSAESYIKKSEKLIDKMLARYPQNPTLYAYKGSFVGFKIAMNKFKAPKLGPQSMKFINKAYKLNPNDIQALADRGNMLYYAPGIFGGNKKKGMDSIKQAIKQIEIENKIRNNWQYLNLLTTLAKYYQENGENSSAISIYEKILNIEPNYEWVKNELYPSLKINTVLE